MATGKTSKLLLEIAVDKAAANQLKNELGRVVAEIAAIDKELRGLESSAEISTKALQRIELAGRGKRLIENLEQATEETRALEKAAEDAKKELAGIDGATGNANMGANRVGRNFTALSRFSNTAGLEGAGQGFAIGDDVLDAVEAAKEFKSVWPQMVGGISNAIPGVNALAGGLQQLIPQMSTAAAQTAVLGGAAVAITAIGFGVNYLIQEQEKEREQRHQQFLQDKQDYADILEAQEQYIALLREGTTEQVQTEQQKLQDQIDNAQAFIDTQQPILDIYERFTGVRGNLRDLTTLQVLQADGFKDLTGAEFENIGQVRAVIEAVNEWKQEMVIAQTSLDLLTQGVEAGATAAADAAAAHGVLVQMLNEGTQQQLADRIELAKRERDWSAEQVEDRLSDIDIERAAIEEQIAQNERFAAAGLDTSEQTQQLREQLSALTTEEQNLIDVVTPAAAAREHQADVEKELAEAAEAASKSEEERTRIVQRETERILELAQKNAEKREQLETNYAADTEKITAKRTDTLRQQEEDYSAETIKIAANRHIQLVQQEQDFSLKRSRDQADFYADLADFDAENYRKRDDILQDIAQDLADVEKDKVDEIRAYNKESERSAEEHERRLLDIKRSSQRNQLRAASKLDAASIYDLQKQAEDETTVEENQYEVERKQREEDYRDRLAELDQLRSDKLIAGQKALQDQQAQYAAERQARINDFNLKQSQAQQDYNISRQRQQEAWQADDAQRQAQYTTNRTRQQAAWDLEDTDRQTHFDDAIEDTKTGYDDIRTETQTGLANIESEFSASLTRIANNASLMGSGGIYGAGATAGSSSYGGYRGLAGGGTVYPGERVMVGEGGEPEWLRMMSGYAQVTPMRGGSGGSAAGKSVNITNNWTINGAANPQNVQAQIDTRFAQLLDQIAG